MDGLTDYMERGNRKSGERILRERDLYFCREGQIGGQ